MFSICLEHAERLMPKIIEAMPGVSLEIDGTEVPVVGLFTHKQASEPLLEIADQLTWRAERQYKDQAPGQERTPEFIAVFPEVAALRHLPRVARRYDERRRRTAVAAQLRRGRPCTCAARMA